MPLEMPYDDLYRDLRNCVVMYKNKPVYVTAIGHDGTVIFRDLLSQREENAPFTIKDFSNPIRRVGFVNVLGSVVYVSRIPVRKFFMGLNYNNTQVKALAGVDYEHGSGLTRDKVRSLCLPELGDAIMDKYPTLAEAAQRVKKFRGAVAFDKQFAITSRKDIYYKGERVGSCGFDAKDTSDIKWDEGKQHLAILLDGNHEKTVRDFRPKSN